MKHLLTVLIVTVLSLPLIVSAYADDKVYTYKEITEKEGCYYDKKTDERINGILKVYDESGKLEAEIPVKDGLAHGVAKYYDPAGALSGDRTYQEGKLHGVKRSYGEDGSLISERIFENNRLISGYLYKENGDREALSKDIIDEYNASLPHPFAKKEAEAVKKIQAAIESIEKPEYDENQSGEERHKSSIEMFSKGFEKAGYNYLETIEQVADDLKNHPERVPPEGESRHKLIIMLMALQKSHCQYDKIDCLRFYPPETRKAVQFLWEKTGWSI